VTNAIPAGVILPSRTSFATRRRFDADQLLPAFLGVNFLAYLSSSMRLTRLSTHPTQSASSTASS